MKYVYWFLSFFIAFSISGVYPSYAEERESDIRKNLIAYYEYTMFSTYGDIAGLEQRAGKVREDYVDVTDGNGIIGSYICDFDGDGQEEFLCLRLESKDIQTRVILEMFEWEEHEIYRNGIVEYTTTSIAMMYHDLRLALFLSDLDAAGPPILHLYSDCAMNDRSEAVRSLSYDASGFYLIGADNLEIGGYHWAERRENIKTGDSETLVPFSGSSMDGWEVVEREQIKSHDENHVEYFDESVESYIERREALYNRYCQKLKEHGISRKETISEQSDESVAALFDQPEDLMWVAEFFAITESTDGKRFIAVDHHPMDQLPLLSDSKDSETSKGSNSQDYIDQHVAFAESAVFYDRMNSRFSDDLKKGLDQSYTLPAEIVYDLLDDVNSIATMKYGKISLFENPYDAILAELVLSLGNRAAAELSDWSEINPMYEYGKPGVKFINKLMSLIYTVQPDYELSKAELSTALWDLLSNPKSMKQKSPALYESLADFLESHMDEDAANKMLRDIDFGTGVLNGLEKYMAVLDWGQDIVNEMAELYRLSVVLEIYDSMSMEMKEALHDASEKIPNEIHREHMKKALKNLEHYLTAENVMAALIESGTWDVLEISYENLASTVFQPVLLSVIKDGLDMSDTAFHTWLAAVKAYQVGWSISTDISKNDTIVECRELIRANYFLAQVVYDRMESDRYMLLAEPTYENAVRFDASYNILRTCEKYSLGAYKRYLEAQQESLVNTIIHKVLLGNKNYNQTEIKRADSEIEAWNDANCHIASLDESVKKGIRVDFIKLPGIQVADFIKDVWDYMLSGIFKVN